MRTRDGTDIRVVDAPERSRFEVRVDGEIAGFTEYRRRPGLIAFIHTLIDPRFEGHGLGSQLCVRRSRSHAPRASQCSRSARSCGGYIAGHTEYLDLVREDMRAKFELPAHG